jgi:hypothetical protein
LRRPKLSTKEVKKKKTNSGVSSSDNIAYTDWLVSEGTTKWMSKGNETNCTGTSWKD